MPASYHVHPIGTEEIDFCHLLLAAAGHDLTEARWREFAKRLIEWRGATGLHDEIYVATDAHNRVRGLAVVQVVPSLLFGRMLDVPVFVTASAGDEDGVVQCLLDAVEDKARNAACAELRVWSQGGQEWKRATAGGNAEMAFAGLRLVLDQGGGGRT
jgi:hypothetical protein